MTRPEIIRADTIDLQNRDAPSAKDHSHVKASTSTEPSPSDLDPFDNPHQLSSHQAETVRGVAAETAEDRRISWTGSNLSDLHIYGADLAADIADTINLTSHTLQESTIETADHSMTTRQQQDALAVAQNGGVATNTTEEDMEDVDDELDDDMMDKISSSPSIEDEDIDFEFVYALHTFMATVEGQANATKGDTMVLLDDSNSYWWLVRVVKDSSIGYLPAEHIETPTERLARLNKHRNIDLSATMLGDQAEKTKNPLMSAMRRRKAKTVAFAAPTYVDYSDIDYSTDEEDLEAEYFAQQQAQQQQQQDEHKEDSQKTKDSLQNENVTAKAGQELYEEDESAKVEPLKPRASKENDNENDKTADAEVDDPNGDASRGKDLTRTSEEIFEASKSETPGPKKTKDGTVRDSFFKDDTVETKKITLTPNLLRDDSAPRTSSESKDLKPRPSLDRIDKDFNALLVKDDKKKKDKKEKDKKAGGFRSLFSRKDKKRGDMEDDELSDKRSMDINGEFADRDYDEVEEEDMQEKASPSTVVAAAPTSTTGPQRQPSKLQKQQPLSRIAEVSPTRKPQKDTGTVRMVDSEGAQSGSSQDGSPKEASSSATVHKSTPAPISNTALNGTGRPQKVTKATTRAVLDEFDSDEEMGVSESQEQVSVSDEEQLRQRQQLDGQVVAAQGPQKDSAGTKSHVGITNGGSPAVTAAAAIATNGINTYGPAQSSERLSESPVQVSPVNSNNLPALMVDTSSQEEEDRSSPISSPSPDLVESEGRSGNHQAQDSITTSTSATTANTATWNDASLRAFFDSGTDVRDLLLVVYDKSDVVPAGPDHPVVSTLFKEQNDKLAEITNQLDSMLGDWLARKQRLRGTF